MSQLTLEGQTMAEVAIDRLRFHEPKEGYWLAFSGGKDSTVIYDLAVRAGVKFDAHYNVTGIDPTELVKHIREHYPTVIWDMPEHHMWDLIQYHGMPRRQARWCCAQLKERGGHGRTIIPGIRWAESKRRKATRGLYEACFRDTTKHYLNPIIDWPTDTVWEYIRANRLPYCSLYDQGFDRLGCVLCPMIDNPEKITAMFQRWPKICEAWHRAALRYWEKSDAAKKMGTAEDFWQWWISRKAQATETPQLVMFE